MDFTDTKPIQNVGTDLSLPSPAATSAPAPASAPAPVIKRRSPIACRRWVNATNTRALPRPSPAPCAAILTLALLPPFCRCRRMRSKCLHDKAKPPCVACREAGLSAADWYVSPVPPLAAAITSHLTPTSITLLVHPAGPGAVRRPGGCLPY